MKLNLDNLNDLTFCIAEVIEVTPFDTYNYIKYDILCNFEK